MSILLVTHDPFRGDCLSLRAASIRHPRAS